MSLISRIDQQSDSARAWDYLDPESQLFPRQSLYRNQCASHTASWPSFARRKTRTNRIDQADANYSNCLGSSQGCECRWHASCHKEARFEPTQFIGNSRKPIDLSVRISFRDIEIPPL